VRTENPHEANLFMIPAFATYAVRGACLDCLHACFCAKADAAI
jgi:hypothetical protein